MADVRSLMDVRAAEKNIPLQIEFDGLIPEVIETDAIRLRQILLNLIGNAIKFTDQGEVKVVVRHEAVDPISRITLAPGTSAADGSDAHSCRLIFNVIDTGIGIQSEVQQTLFEPFVQADSTSTRSFGGTGLGLTICRRLARALGGDVSVQSEFGKGSTFTVSIQAQASGKLIQPNLILSKEPEAPTQEIRLSCAVLIVDDRRDIRFLAQHFVEKSGGNVFTATNGREAVDFIANPRSPKVDVIVMDMQMPVMDGYEAAAELRHRGCELPIIALTANAMKSDRDACLQAGCTDYTTKPLDRRMLIEIIQRLTTNP